MSPDSLGRLLSRRAGGIPVVKDRDGFRGRFRLVLWRLPADAEHHLKLLNEDSAHGVPAQRNRVARVTAEEFDWLGGTGNE